MTPELKDKIARLKDAANKIDTKDWEYGDDFGKPALIANNGCYGVQIAEAEFAGTVDDIKYIAEANPATILELIAELELLEKEADWLAKELSDNVLYGDRTIFNQAAWREEARKAVREEK